MEISPKDWIEKKLFELTPEGSLRLYKHIWHKDTYFKDIEESRASRRKHCYTYRRNLGQNVVPKLGIKEYILSNNPNLLTYINKIRYICARYKLSPKLGVDLYVRKLKGICECCERTSQSELLVVDHCHSSNKIRKVICQRCNIILGYLGDDVVYATNVMFYLYDHRIVPGTNKFIREFFDNSGG